MTTARVKPTDRVPTTTHGRNIIKDCFTTIESRETMLSILVVSGVLLVTLAVFVSTPAIVGLKTIFTATLEPLLIVPSAQTTLSEPLQVP